MDKPVMIAFDFPDLAAVKQFLRQFGQERLFVKVGMELFYKEGPAILTFLKEHGHHIFLDLKLHDIPNTVRSAMRNLASFDVDLVNVHAAGGRQMMAAAIEGLDAGTAAGRKRPTCIAVTQLTSTSEQVMQAELLIQSSLTDVVQHYAMMSRQAGLDGVVCSALEAEQIRKQQGESFLKVTPGIRLKQDEADDQVRITTPAKARQLGSSAIVVGRPITKAEHPLQAYLKVKQEWGSDPRHINAVKHWGSDPKEGNV